MKLLKFQKKILKEWLDPHGESKGDGLVVMGKGMGTNYLLLATCSLGASTNTLIILLNTSASEILEIKLKLQSHQLEYVNYINDLPASQRILLYSKGYSCYTNEKWDCCR